MTSLPGPEATRLGRLPSRLWRAVDTWATRSLAVGAVATVVDLTVGTALLNHGWSARMAAMLGTVVGSTFAFLANRYFAFREHRPTLASPAIRFLVVTSVASVVHGQLVAWLNGWPAYVSLMSSVLPGWFESVVGTQGLPFVPAKMLADIVVYNFGQLILLRYFVFPRMPHATASTTPAVAPAASLEHDRVSG